MIISLKLFLIIIFYLLGCVISIPPGIAYSNNFSSFESKELLYFSLFSWITFWISIYAISSGGFVKPIKTKSKLQKYFQFRFVKRDGMGLRYSDEY